MEEETTEKIASETELLPSAASQSDGGAPKEEEASPSYASTSGQPATNTANTESSSSAMLNASYDQSVGGTTISTKETGDGVATSSSHHTASTSETGGGSASDRLKKKKKEKKEKKEKKQKKEKKKKKHKKHHKGEHGKRDDVERRTEGEGVAASILRSATDELEPIVSSALEAAIPHPVSGQMGNTTEGMAEVRTETQQRLLVEDDGETKPPAQTRRDSKTRMDSSKTAVTESSTIPTASSSSRGVSSEPAWKETVVSKPQHARPVSLSSVMAEQEVERIVAEEDSAKHRDTETEEEKMLRMAMEMSLKEYEQYERNRPASTTVKRRATEPVPRVRRRGSRDRDDLSQACSEASSDRSILSLSAHEATEVVLDNPVYGQTTHRAEHSSSSLNVNWPEQPENTSPRSSKRRSEPGPKVSLGGGNETHRAINNEKSKGGQAPHDRTRPGLVPPTVLTIDAEKASKVFADDNPKAFWFDDDEDPKDEWFADYAMHTFPEPSKNSEETKTEESDARQPESMQQPGGNAWGGARIGAVAVTGPGPTTSESDAVSTPASLQEVTASGHISLEEAAMIEKALREADEVEYRKNFYAALQLQGEEAERFHESKQRSSQQGNVRTMTREEYAQSQSSSLTPAGAHCDADLDEVPGDDGFRMNAARPSERWLRSDRNTVIGPDSEVRTKHDIKLQARSNAHRLGLDDEVDAGFVGNKAFNAFKQSMQRQTIKGVAAHGHGRATADSDRTSGGLDSRVRHHISHAINNGIIEKCNGVINEGKEAVIYHAMKGPESDGFDVAIKVFKRIKEFKGRGMYVDGDPRYDEGKFRNSSSREQLELWTEKEYRNLLRANRAGVSVPSPILYKENALFMRFLGEDGWAVPQLKELKLRQGSSKWNVLYQQVMIGIRRLFHGARLVHGDLSEYNILVAPAHLVENVDDSIDPNDDQALQAVLIDFGQAVDWRHPSAMDFLERDLRTVRDFFKRMGIKTLDVESAVKYVTSTDTSQSDADSLSMAAEESLRRESDGKATVVTSSPRTAAPVRLSKKEPIRLKSTKELKRGLNENETTAGLSSDAWGHESHESLDSTEWTANFDNENLFK